MEAKKEEEALQEAESTVKKQNVTMSMDVFDCLVCSKPLKSPIFQVKLDAFLVWQHTNHVETLVLLCSFRRYVVSLMFKLIF